MRAGNSLDSDLASGDVEAGLLIVGVLFLMLGLPLLFLLPGRTDGALVLRIASWWPLLPPALGVACLVLYHRIDVSRLSPFNRAWLSGLTRLLAFVLDFINFVFFHEPRVRR